MSINGTKHKRRSWADWHTDYSEKNWLSAGTVDNPMFVGKIPATYVVIHGGKVVYVGSTTKLSNRLVTHRSTLRWRGMGDAKIKYRPSRKYGDWAMVEIRLIRRLKPILNKEHNHNAGGARCLTAS